MDAAKERSFNTPVRLRGKRCTGKILEAEHWSENLRYSLEQVIFSKQNLEGNSASYLKVLLNLDFKNDPEALRLLKDDLYYWYFAADFVIRF